MNNKYFLYALFVTIGATTTSWAKLFGSPSAGTRGGSSWSSHSGGGGGFSGGGHK